MGIPARPPGRKAVGIFLAPATGRAAALAIVGIPLAVFLIIGFVADAAANSGGGDDQSQSPYGVSQTVEQSYPEYSPSYPTDSTDSGLVESTDSTSDYGYATDSASATDSGTSTATGTASASPSPTATGPAAVVLAAYADINNHDYEGAYALGLDLNGESYQDFAAGYSTTKSDTITVTGVSGDVVYVTLLAVRTDGTQSTYSGTYTVTGATITGADLNQVS